MQDYAYTYFHILYAAWWVFLISFFFHLLLQFLISFYLSTASCTVLAEAYPFLLYLASYDSSLYFFILKHQDISHCDISQGQIFPVRYLAFQWDLGDYPAEDHWPSWGRTLAFNAPYLGGGASWAYTCPCAICNEKYAFGTMNQDLTFISWKRYKVGSFQGPKNYETGIRLHSHKITM